MADSDDRRGLSIIIDFVDHSKDTNTYSIEGSAHQFFAANWERMIGEFCNCIVYATKD